MQTSQRQLIRLLESWALELCWLLQLGLLLLHGRWHHLLALHLLLWLLGLLWRCKVVLRRLSLLLLLGHQFGEIVELGVFLNLGGRLLNQESQVGLQLEDLCRVVRVDQLKRLLKVKDRNIRESIFEF